MGSDIRFGDKKLGTRVVEESWQEDRKIANKGRLVENIRCDDVLITSWPFGRIAPVEVFEFKIGVKRKEMGIVVNISVGNLQRERVIVREEHLFKDGE